MTRGKAIWFLFAGMLCWSCTTTDHDYLVYVGTYTGQGSDGIYAYRFHSGDGHLTPIGLAAKSRNPSFFIIDSTRTFLYAVQEVDSFQGKSGGALSVYRIDRASGKLALLQETSTGGGAPCHLSFDEKQRYLMVANYGGGNALVFPIEENGLLGQPSAHVQHVGFSVNPDRQNGPHAHAIQPTPGNTSVAVTDLGIDKVMLYPFDPTQGTLDSLRAQALVTSPGSGPRHLTFSPDGKTLYVLLELTSMIAVYSWNPGSGSMESIQSVPLLPAGFKGSNTSAEILIDPSGKYLYASNRGDDSLVAFIIEPDGRLTFAGRFDAGGHGPRHFEIDPTGRWLMTANQLSGNLALFSVGSSGELVLTWKNEKRQSPVCVRFVPVK